MKASSNTKSVPTIPPLSIHASPKTSQIYSNTPTQPTTPEPQLSQTLNNKRRTLSQIRLNSDRCKPMAVLRTERVVSSRSKEQKIDDKFFNLMEGIRGARENSEKRLQETIEGIAKQRKQPKEKLKWEEMVETGQYIGSRKPEKIDGVVSGRAVSKEKVFKEIRHQIIGLKYERKNQARVVKHLTTKEQPDPATLLQPQVTLTAECRLPSAKKETYRVLHSARQSTMTFEEFKGEKAVLNFHAMNSPHLEPEQQKMITFNKEQLKKLKGGLNYMNKWMLKYNPKIRGPTLRSEDVSLEYEALEPNKKQEANQQGDYNSEENKLLQKTVSRAGEAELMQRKLLSRKQTIEERVINLDPQAEFLRRIGFSQADKTSKSSFFATAEDIAMAKETNETMQRDREIFSSHAVTSPDVKLKKIDLSQSQHTGIFFPTPKFRNASPRAVFSNEPSYTESAIRTPRDNTYVKEADRFSSSSAQNTPRIFARTIGENKASWRTMKKSLMSRESARGARTPKPNEKVDVEKEKEKEELFDRLKRISADCQDVKLTSKEIRGALTKDMGELEKKLDRLGEVPIGDRVIDENLEKEIKDQIVNSYVINPHFGKILMRRFAVGVVMK